MEEKAKKRMWTATWVLLAVSVLILYVTHKDTRFMMDDLWYSTLLSDDTPIASFRDIIVSQIWHYNNWGGRSITHGILQLTLLAGEKAADLLNMLMTFLLAWMICRVSQNRRLPALFAAVALPLGLNANWKMSMFWQAGAANYLYITVFILAFAFCYLRELPEEKVMSAERDGKIQTSEEKMQGNLPGITFWIFPLGIVTGWSNENMGPTMWILSLIVIFCAWKEKRKVSLWMILGSLACLIGSIMVIAAPGNFVRSAQAPENQYGILWRIYLRCYSESRAAFEYLFPTLLTLVIVLLLAKAVGNVRLGRRNWLLLFCALLSWGAMILSPHYPDRAAFGTMVLLICVILSIAGRVLQKRKDLAWPLWGIAVLIWLKGMYFCCEQLGLSWGWIR